MVNPRVSHVHGMVIDMFLVSCYSVLIASNS
nr:MAG TPA: hypothetical protein [Caudoviricetes sp.]